MITKLFVRLGRYMHQQLGELERRPVRELVALDKELADLLARERESMNPEDF